MAARSALSAARALVHAAAKVPDPLLDLPELKQFVTATGSLLYLTSYRAREAPSEVLDWCFELCRDNMKPMYEAVWGWSDTRKRKQLLAGPSRLILAYELALNKAPVGFVNYRFEIEDGLPILYLYEIQIAPAAQKQGLGVHFMSVLEHIAWRASMAKVMLTVFRCNTAAVSLYRKLGYGVDETSPLGLADLLAQPADPAELPPEASAAPGYWIMSKPVAGTTAAAAAAGQAAVPAPAGPAAAVAPAKAAAT